MSFISHSQQLVTKKLKKWAPAKTLPKLTINLLLDSICEITLSIQPFLYRILVSGTLSTRPFLYHLSVSGKLSILLFWTLHHMYTSHSRRMPVILMPPFQTASEIFSHKPHTEVFFPLHHRTKFPVRTESLLRCLAKPMLRIFPSSRLGMCSSVQIPCSKLPSFHNRFCIFSSDKSSMTSCLNDTTMDWKKQWFRWEKISKSLTFLQVSFARYAFCISIAKCI